MTDATTRFRTTHAVIESDDPVKNAREAVRKIRGDFAGFRAAMVIFFAATDYDPDTLASEMRDAFPGALTLGCTSAGEAVDATLLNASVVAMAYSEAAFDVCEAVLIVENAALASPARRVFASVADAADALARSLGRPLIRLDYREYVGFVLGERISPFSERVLDEVGEITDVIFVGGFAGDDYHFNDGQRIFFNGESHARAAVLALWKPKNGFALLKTQAVEPTNSSLVVTRADEKKRIIWEFDGKDAAPTYAEVIGRPAETVDILDFDEYPLAFTADGEPFIQAIVRQVDGKGLQMFANIHQGMRQTITRAGDVLAATRRDFEEKRREMGGNIAAILHVNCASRLTALKNRNQQDDFSRLFSGVPGITLYSYGEVYVGVVALTSTMILFK